MPVQKTKFVDTRRPDFVELFEESAKQTATNFLRYTAEKLTQELKDAIFGQRYNWFPLSPRYLAEKVRQGYDPRILIRTKQYVESIQTFGPEEAPHGVLFRVGVPDEEHNSGLPFRELARIMEFGRRDGQKPYARPHWRPTWGIFVRDLTITTNRFRSQILSDFRDRLNE